jgi:hypothetical protein
MQSNPRLTRRIPPDAYAPAGRSDQSFPNTGNAVDGVAHHRQPSRCRVHDFEDRLFRLSEPRLGGFRAGPDNLDRLFVAVIVFTLGCRHQGNGDGRCLNTIFTYFAPIVALFMTRSTA